MKKVIWIGSSYENLKEFPPPVRNAVGYATPKKELELIRNRLREAKALYQAIKSEKKK